MKEGGKERRERGREGGKEGGRVNHADKEWYRWNKQTTESFQVRKEDHAAIPVSKGLRAPLTIHKQTISCPTTPYVYLASSSSAGRRRNR